MAKLNANYDAERSAGILIPYPVAGASTIYKNALVCGNTDGYLQPGEDASGYLFVGVAYEKGDNSSGRDGDIDVRTWKEGTYVFATNFAADQGDVGTEVYVIDDHTVGLTNTNGMRCGYITEILAHDEVRIRIDGFTH